MSDLCDHVDCRTAMRQLWDYLDAELTPARMEGVRRHLDKCRSCYPQYDFEKAFLEAIASCKEQRCASAELRARIISSLREAGFAGSGSGD